MTVPTPQDQGPWGYGQGPIYKLFHRVIDSFGNVPGWWGRMKDRWSEYWDLVAELNDEHPTLRLVLVWPILTQSIAYTLGGKKEALDLLKLIGGVGNVDDVSKNMANLLHEALKDNRIREIVEVFGSVITEPILTIFEEYAGRDDVDPKEFARAFHGIMIGLTTTGSLLDTTLETITAGQVEGAGRFLNSMYWSLGLGFLGWQTLAPLLESGLQPGLDRYYKKLYRPARFSAADLRDLYALGEITQDQLYEEARLLGWRDKDIEQWLKLAFRTLGQGDVFAAYHQDLIDESEAVKRLRVIGYDPEDIPLLFKLNPKDAIEEEKATSLTTARAAYRDHLIGEDEFRQLLADLGKPQREIDLIVAIENAKAKTDARGLSVGQIKGAWQENVITDLEAEHWLEETGIAADSVEVLLQTWKAEIAPVFRKLNLGTITGAYVEGVIDRGTAQSKLVEIGLSADDADLELKLAEKRNPESFGQIAPASARRLSPALLSDLVALGLITGAQMTDRLVQAGYDQADAALLTQAAELRASAGARKLSQSSISQAYLAGVVDRPKAEELLGQLNFGPDQVGIILDTLEAQNPEAFGGPPEIRIKQLSPAALEDLYIADVISQDRYIEGLLQLGFSETDTAALVTRADQFKEPGQRVITQNTIERAYLAGVFDRTRAYDKLVALDFSPEDANTILDTVESENPAAFSPGLVQSSRLPSITTLVAALQNGILTTDEYLARANELGYSVADAQLYLSVAANTERKGTTDLTTSQILNAYSKGFFSRGVALQRLTQRGYNDEDAVLLIRMEKDIIQNTDTWDSLLNGALDPFDAIAALVNANYSDADILDAFSSLPPQTLDQMGIDLEGLRQTLAAIPGGS